MARIQKLPVKPAVLKWARVTAGYSISQAAQELHVKTDFILDIESRPRSLSKTLLNQLAQLYKRSLVVLFLPEPPDEARIPTDYRLLPNQKQVIGPVTAQALREARRLQEVLSDLVEHPNATSSFRDLTVGINSNTNDVGSNIRKIIGINIDEQKKWRDPGYAFRTWRGKLQKLGVNVMVEDFPREEARGFSLWHPELVPMIVVSHNEASAAQIFTLFHELAHILLCSDAMCLKKEDDTLLGGVEAWCNRVAAATLVPESELRNIQRKYEHTTLKDWELDDLYEMASLFKVSRHVIAIRLEQIGYAPKGYYNRVKELLTADDYLIRKKTLRDKEDIRRNIPQERLAELGFGATTTILEACRKSELSTIEAADLLRLQPAKFEQLSNLAYAQSQRYG